MDKLVEDIGKIAEKNPLVAGVLATIFGFYIVGQLELKKNPQNFQSLSPTQPSKPNEDEDVNWREIALSQSENVGELVKLVNKLIEEKNGKVQE